MAILGKRQALKITREAPPGFYLDGGEHGEILLPRRYVPRDLGPGAMLDVFVHRDSEDRLVATTGQPIAEVGQCAFLRVAGVKANVGAFLDWGLDKDLLLPNREQLGHPRIGDRLVVCVVLDERSQRLMASARLNRWLDLTPPNFTPGQKVGLLIAAETPLGYKAIVNHTHTGLLYRAELSGPLEIGQHSPGFVRAMRPDGKIDLGLDPSGYKRVAPLSETILEKLKAAAGRLPFHDGSSPEEIREAFGTSKKAFKQALGALYREKQIEIGEGEIRLAPRKPKPARKPR